MHFLVFSHLLRPKKKSPPDDLDGRPRWPAARRKVEKAKDAFLASKEKRSVFCGGKKNMFWRVPPSPKKKVFGWFLKS